jgi:type II restriction enzyme
MSCIEHLDKRDFTLDDMYGFAGELQRKHPQNAHVKPKIRQQLQVLRDAGLLTFAERGHYVLTSAWYARR